MLTEWLAPLPEEDYVRILYVGRFQIFSKTSDDSEDIKTTELEDMINDIWQVASIHNIMCNISGHLSWTKDFHVAQIMEGKDEDVTALMAKIRKDTRVVIFKEFRRNLQTMNQGWQASLCYSFQITSKQYRLIADEDLTLEQMFNRMKDTYRVRREGLKLSQFYKTTVDTFLLKYISIEEKVRFKKVMKDPDLYYENKLEGDIRQSTNEMVKTAS